MLTVYYRKCNCLFCHKFNQCQASSRKCCTLKMMIFRGVWVTPSDFLIKIGAANVRRRGLRFDRFLFSK